MRRVQTRFAIDNVILPKVEVLFWRRVLYIASPELKLVLNPYQDNKSTTNYIETRPRGFDTNLDDGMVHVSA